MSGSSQTGKRTRRRYSEQFKRDAVGLVTEQHYPLAEAARRLDIHASVLRNWKEKFMKGNDQKSGEKLSESEREELREEIWSLNRLQSSGNRDQSFLQKSCCIFFLR